MNSAWLIRRLVDVNDKNALSLSAEEDLLSMVTLMEESEALMQHLTANMDFRKTFRFQTSVRRGFWRHWQC